MPNQVRQHRPLRRLRRAHAAGQPAARLTTLVEQTCQAWLGTPWVAGQAVRGGGVDCVRFAVAVWDEIAGLTTTLPPLPQDVALHAEADGALTAVLRSLDRTHGATRITPSALGVLTVRPADLLVARVGANGAAGHALIVGAAACYHADRGARQVVTTGLPAAHHILHAYRPSWAAEDL